MSAGTLTLVAPPLGRVPEDGETSSQLALLESDQLMEAAL